MNYALVLLICNLFYSCSNNSQEFVTYYPNGQIKYKGQKVNDKLDGQFIKFYPSGKIENKSCYSEGKVVGEDVFYFENGKINQKSLYNNLGQEIYLIVLDSTGKKRNSRPMPILNTPKDTLLEGDVYKSEISFHYKLSGSLKLLVGTLDKRNELVDTFAVITPNKDQIFTHTFKPTKLGKNALGYKFIHQPENGDTLNVDGISINRAFFVKK